MFNGRRQPSRDGTSRMTREYQVRFCERLGVKFPGPTRQKRRLAARPLGLLHLSHPTLAVGVGTAGSCHNRTHALQQTASLLDHLLGAQ